MPHKYEYSVNEVPPIPHLVVLSFQHVMLMFISIGFPILLANQMNASIEFTASLITLSMLACGFGSIIQSAGIPYIGSKYLCPNLVGPSYFSLSLSAVWIGGIPLMRGMLILAGLIEMILAPVIQKLKNIFPTYVVGLVVAMVGVSVIQASVSSFFGLQFKGDAINSLDFVMGMFTLLTMVFCNIWGKGFVRMYCLLIGMLIGWIVTTLVIPEYRIDSVVLQGKPLFALPRLLSGIWDIKIDMKMVIPFIVIAISSTLKTFGNLLAAQRISVPDQTELDFKPIREGLMADGIATAASGFLGAMAVDTSSSNIGLAGSTKVVSRWLSVGAGVIFIVLAFLPRLAMILSLIPKPVLGAAIIYTGCFMIIAGLQEMFVEQWNIRRTFVIGISLFFGLSTAFLPGLYARAPQFIQSFFTDPLPTATILAVVLHQVINLDILFKRKQKPGIA
jgi:xanthine permease XanP